MNTQRIVFWPAVGVRAMLVVVLLAVMMASSATATITYKWTETATRSSVSSLTITHSGDVVQGDFLLAQITLNAATGTISQIPSGWILVASRNSSASKVGSAIYRKLVVSSETASYTWSFSSSVSANGAIIAYRGVKAGDPIAAAHSENDGSGNSLTATAVTAVPNSMLVALYGTEKEKTLSAPSGMSDPPRYMLKPSGGKVSSMAADQAITLGGSTGSRVSTTSGSDKWVAHLVDLGPDTTAPVLTLPSNMTVKATSFAGAAVTFAPTATDDVDGSVAVTCVPASGSTFALGTTTVNCSATDAAGNTATGSFTVTVKLTLYLHNKPTPPTGDTNSQSNLQMSPTEPPGTFLWNYDKDCDAAPGRLVRKGGSATNLNRALYLNWRAVVPAGGLTLSGDAELRFFAGMKDFTTRAEQRSKRGCVAMFLREIALSGVATNLGSGFVDRSSWHNGSSDWVQEGITFANLDRTIAAGNTLEVKIIVDSASDDDMWFAYDTEGFPARLIVP